MRFVRLLLFLTLAVATHGSAADAPLTAQEAANIKSYDLPQVQALTTSLNGEVLKIKFTYRLPETELLDKGAVKGTVGFSALNITTGVSRVGTMVAIVPPEGRAWFMKLPTEATSKKVTVAIARLKIVENVAQLDLLGREIKNELKGPQIVWKP